jgi:Plasmid pRiA4b ORF-3-like protein
MIGGRARLTAMTQAEIEKATAPALWLLGQSADGIPLTQTHALARTVVREAAERWPSWWDAELFGPPHRETDLAVLHALDDGLRRLRLVRRRGRRLMATARGRNLVADPAALLSVLAGDLGANDPFTDEIAAAVVDALRADEHCEHDDLASAATARVRRTGWHDPDGKPPTVRDVSWIVGDVLRRGEAYGLIQRHPDPAQPRLRGRRIALSDGGRLVLGADLPGSLGTPVLIFYAKLMNAHNVKARLAVRADQHLTALHDAIQEAFGWYDDHLYSFWLDGTFWGDRSAEITSPHVPDEGIRTADLPIAELALASGAKIAYVFDFGDEWRVELELKGTEEPDGERYPRVLERTGRAPPQYPALDDD